MADFAFEVAAFVAKAKERAGVAFRAIAAELDGRVKELTPVDTGFLRASWAATLSPGLPVVPRPAKGEIAAAAVVSAASDSVIAGAQLGETIYILNPVEYGPYVEYGTSRMAPRGMVAQTVAEAPTIAEATVARIAAT